MSYLNGPDQIIKCDNLTTCNINGAVKFRSTGHPFENVTKPCSVPGLLHDTATKYPDTVALISNDDNGNFKKYTYKQYEEMVRICAKGFLKLGLERFHPVSILGYNSPEWFFSEISAIYAGGVANGIYLTNTSEACFYILSNSKTNIIVVEDEEQLQKILVYRDKLPHLKAIIQYSGVPKHEGVLSWDQLIEIGKKESDERLENVLKTIAINQCCVLVYTSGTIGNPKAAMISHDNIIFNCKGIGNRISLRTNDESIISYLPLSHIAAQVVDIFMTMAYAATLHFADKNAMRGSLVKTLKHARPTRFLGVPRVYEKIYEAIQKISAQSSFLKRSIATWARGQGLHHNLNRTIGVETNSWGYTIANALVLKKIKQAMGFDRCVSFSTAAAPLSSEIKKFFMSIDMSITEAYGLTEIAGAHTKGCATIFDLDSVATALSGVISKLEKVNENDKSGELCMYGRHVFMGYYNDPEKTKEAIDKDGWFHSGDLAYIDKNDRVYITGRMKELLITAGGENIAPYPIEERLMKELPYISNAVLIGDKRKFLSILITLKTEIDPDTTAPTDKLTDEVINWIKKLGSTATTVTELLKEGPGEMVLKAIQSAIDKVNLQAISNAQKIQKFTILPKDFSIVGEEIGPTMKIKRNVVVNKYINIIEELYSK